MARALHEKADLPFFEIYVNTPLAECEKRDVKGLYKKARAGKIKGFTGIDQPYEAPDNPDLSLKTVNRTIGETVLEVIELLEKNGIIPRAANDKVLSAIIFPFSNMFSSLLFRYPSFMFPNPNSRRKRRRPRHSSRSRSRNFPFSGCRSSPKDGRPR